MCEMHSGPREYYGLKEYSGQESPTQRREPAERNFDSGPVVVAFEFHVSELDPPNEFTQIAVITCSWLANRLIRCSN